MKKSRNRNLFGVALLLLGGLYLGDRLFLQKRNIASFDGNVATSGSDDYYDLSERSGKEFQKFFKYALVQGLLVHRDSISVGLAMGLFQVKNEGGSKVYACEKYPNVELTLQAEGIAVSGNIPTMIVRGPCVPSDDGRRILAFKIPLKDLAKNLRENPIFKVSTGERDENFMISAQHLYTEWPTQWNVVGIKLYNDQETLHLDGYELISLLDQALTLDFSESP